MTERLTLRMKPEILDRMGDDASDPLFALALHQAARDARTLARVRAWTEEDVPLRVKVGNYTMRRSVLSVTADRVTRLAVAALLRAEEPSRG